MALAREICEDCGKTFWAGPRAFICPDCRKERLRRAARLRQLNKLGNAAYSEQRKKAKEEGRDA